MSSTEKTETQVVAEIGQDYKYGFHETDDYFFKSGRGLSREIVEQISEMKNEPEWMREVPPEGARVLLARPTADVGRRHERDQLRQHPLLHPADREAGDFVGRRAAGHQEHVRQAGHPRGRAEVPRGRRRAVRVGGRLPQAPRGPREEGRDLRRHRLGPARARGARQAVLRHDHPAERQQVRGAQLGGLVGRVVRLRAAGSVRSTSRSRPTSGSTPRTWASSSGR